MNKKLLMTILTLTLIFSFVHADKKITVKVDNKNEIKNESLLIEKGTTYCESTAFAKVFGAKTFLSGDKKEMIVTKFDKDTNYILYFVQAKDVENQNKIIIKDAKDKFSISENSPTDIKSYKAKAFAIKLKKKKVYIPLRQVSQVLSYDIKWNGKTRTIEMNKIIKPKVKPKEVKKKTTTTNPVKENDTEQTSFEIVNRDIEINYNEEDLDFFKRIIMCETGTNGSYDNRLAVANVIINRVLSNDYADTIKGVILENGQFPPAHLESFYSIEIDKTCEQPILDALSGQNNIDNCLFFNNKEFPWKPESDFYGKIDGNYFYR